MKLELNIVYRSWKKTNEFNKVNEQKWIGCVLNKHSGMFRDAIKRRLLGKY